MALVHHQTCQQTSGTTLTATVGTDATSSTDASTFTTTGPGGSLPLAFDCQPGDDILAVDTSLAGRSTWSIACWAYDLSYGNSSFALTLYKAGTGATNMLGIDPWDVAGGNGVRVYGEGGNLVVENGATRTGWHHFLVSSSPANGLRVYVDGVRITVTGDETSATVDADVDRIGIGHYDGLGDMSDPVCDVRLYDSDEGDNALAIAHDGLGSANTTLPLPVTWYKCQDDAASTTVAATVGANATAAVNTSTFSTDGPGGNLPKAFEFSSGEDIIATNTALAGATDWTIAFWASRDSYIVSDVAVALYESTPSSPTTVAPFDSSGGDGARVFTNGGSRIDEDDATRTGWHHFLVCNSSTNKLRLFVDGVLEESSGNAYSPDASVDRVSIGSYAGTQDFFNGKIADVRLYDSDEGDNAAEIMADGVDSEAPDGGQQPKIGIGIGIGISIGT